MAHLKKIEEEEEDDDDRFEEFRPSLWRMPLISPSIPMIAINEKELKFDALEPQSSKFEIRSSTTSDIISTFQPETEDDGESLSESNIHEKIRPNSKKDDNSGIHHHLKFWRRKLLVLIWLNFLLRYRKRFKTFVEFLFPVITLAFICGFVI